MTKNILIHRKLYLLESVLAPDVLKYFHTYSFIPFARNSKFSNYNNSIFMVLANYFLKNDGRDCHCGTIFKKEAVRMETSMHYPFIYFFYDTNQVLVYRIQALEYITIAEVMREGNGRGMSLSHLNLLQHFIMNKAHLSRDGLSLWGRKSSISW